MSFSTEEHWKFFAEFCEYEIKSGGPDPQLATIAEMSRRETQAERLWRAGCYIAVYNVAYAEALWRQWPWLKANHTSNRRLREELEEQWSKITTRVERRCVRRPDWMAEFLIGYKRFAIGFDKLKKECAALPPKEAYLHAWDSALEVPRLGRYVALKLLEYLRRYEGLKIEAPDIRPKGGWSPRSTIATLWGRPGLVSKDNSPMVLKDVNTLCSQTLRRLAVDFGLKLDLFQLQVMLCEYRESWEGERQYPGRSLDSELKYALKAEADWGYKSDIWRARKRLFPKQHLGELNGWTGPREIPALALARHKYTWSDLKYNYNDRLREIEALSDAEYKSKFVRTKASKVKVYTIIEGVLYQSGRWTALDVEQCEALRDEYKITGIANFWKDDPRLKDVVAWYKWWPLTDGKSISFEVISMAQEIVARLRAGEKILTMCYGGRNRSGLLSALAAKLWYGCSGAEAVKIVKKARRGALVNKHFVSFLEADKQRAPGTLF